MTELRPRVCLCVIFNHAYVANIPLLRRLYSGRFSAIRFLVPLTRMDDDDVITVYRGSFSHNAYAVDAWPSLKSVACSHFLFVHDDVLLAPAVNEGNLLGVLGLGAEGEGFIPHIQAMPRNIRAWGHFAGPLWRLVHPRNFLSGTGIDSLESLLRALPPVEEARAKLARFGAGGDVVVNLRPVEDSPANDLQGFRYFGDRTPEQDDRFREAYLDMLFDAREGRGSVTIPYPMAVSGPSGDFYVVPRSAMADFVHYSGALAAAGVFVEVAAPMALAFACDGVRTCHDMPVSFTWSMSWLKPEAVLERMRGDRLLIAAHPVKLSMVDDLDAFEGELDRLRDAPVGLAAHILETAPDFEPQAYLAANPDVRAAGVSPWVHFIHHGQGENRPLRP